MRPLSKLGFAATGATGPPRERVAIAGHSRGMRASRGVCGAHVGYQRKMTIIRLAHSTAAR